MAGITFALPRPSLPPIAIPCSACIGCVRHGYSIVVTGDAPPAILVCAVLRA